MLTSQQNKSMVIIFAYFCRADAAADDVKMKPIFIIIQNFDFSWL